MELPGFPISKKNSKRKTKHGKFIPSVRYEIWNKMALAELDYQGPGIEFVAEFVLEVTVPDFARRRDLDNMLTSVLDTLQDAGVLKDDDMKVLPDLRVRGELDERRPLGSTKIIMRGVEYA